MKKISAFLMASTLLLGATLTSCDGGKNSQESKQESSTSQSADLTTKAKIAVTKDSNVQSYSIKVLDLDPTTHAPVGEMTNLAEDGILDPGENRYIAISVVCNDGYEVDKVTSNSNPTLVISGMYCASVSEAGEYKVSIKTKEKSTEVVYATVAEATKDENIESVTYTMAVDSHYSTILELVDGNKVPVGSGNWLYITVTCKEGYIVDECLVNGKVASTQYSYYVYNVKEEGNITVSVTSKVDTSSSAEA